MVLLQNLRGRVGAAIGAGMAAVCFLAFGALFDFVLSPQQAMFIAGIVMMICSPIVLVIGVLGALFGRRSKVTVG